MSLLTNPRNGIGKGVMYENNKKLWTILHAWFLESNGNCDTRNHAELGGKE